jgi:pimeloyl-ACP methyl ester carboxylesterase
MRLLLRAFGVTAATLLLVSCAMFDRGATSENIGNIVLVHGAFEDASSWDGVATLLRSQGFHVATPELPLTSLDADVASARAAVAGLKGPVLLVGHSWGGTVITQMSADDRVSGLVYVAGTAPVAGESTSALMKDYPSPALTQISQDAQGSMHVSEQGMCEDIAPGLKPGECQKLAHKQRPIASSAFATPVTTTIPKFLPTWYISAEQDRAVMPALQQSLIERLHATVYPVQTGHDVPLTAAPQVAESIEAAIKQIKKADHS